MMPADTSSCTHSSSVVSNTVTLSLEVEGFVLMVAQQLYVTWCNIITKIPSKQFCLCHAKVWLAQIHLGSSIY
jgi:hypothetical protein